MKIWAISDTHFGHKNVVKYTGRPVDFAEQILADTASKSGDLLIHCGDFAFGNDAMWTDRFLTAASNFKTRVLVKGNHDEKPDAWYYNHGWDFVCEAFLAKHFGQQVIYTHMPVMNDYDKTNEKQLSYWTPHFPPAVNVHGHLHGGGVDRIRSMVGQGHRQSDVEAVGYSIKFHKDLAPELNRCELVDVEALLTDDTIKASYRG